MQAGAAAAFEPALKVFEALIADQRYEVARIEALTMAAVQAKRPKRPLGPATSASVSIAPIQYRAI